MRVTTGRIEGDLMAYSYTVFSRLPDKDVRLDVALDDHRERWPYPDNAHASAMVFAAIPLEAGIVEVWPLAEPDEFPKWFVVSD